MIVFEQAAPGRFQFSNMWKAGTKFKVKLWLKDTQGDIDERDVEVTLTEDVLPYKAINMVTMAVDAEPFWKARSFGPYMEVELLNPDNEGQVTLTIEQG